MYIFTSPSIYFNVLVRTYACTNSSIAQCPVEILLLTRYNPAWAKPKLRPVAATKIHEIANVEKDERKLMVLAHDALEAEIKKQEMKQQSAEKSEPKDESSDQKYTTTVGATSCSANLSDAVTKASKSSSSHDLKKAALERYMKEQNNEVYEAKASDLKDTEELIKGRPQYRLIKGNKEVGLLLIVKAAKSSQQLLTQREKAYHQIQALLYAGNSKYLYCDYVQFDLQSKVYQRTRFEPDKSWQDQVVGNVRKYLEYCDAIWEKTQLQFQDSSTQ